MTSQRLHVLALLLLLPVLTLGAAGCSVAVRGQEVYLRASPRENSARLLVIYKGITATKTKKKTVQDAVEKLQPFLAGQRRVAMQGLWGTWDFETPSRKNPAFAAAARCVELVDHGLFLDEQGQLCGFQELTFHDLHYFVNALNHALSRQVLLDHEQQLREAEAAVERGDEPDAPDCEPFDAHSRELWLERARAGGTWFQLVDDELEVDLPMTRETALRMQAFLIEHATQTDVEAGGLAHIIGQHAVYLRALEHRNESLCLRFGIPDELPARFSFANPGEVLPELRDALEESGAVIDRNLTLESLRNRIQ